ncbi:MAG: protein kinase [Verrucomicrobiota bacterium]|nr:protein kinase [Verrucomicrobiota bacterium]
MTCIFFCRDGTLPERAGFNLVLAFGLLCKYLLGFSMSDGGPEPRGAGRVPATSFVPGTEPGGAVALHPLIGPPPRPGLIGAVGRFELLRQIGEGGMGVVFLARDTMALKRSEGETQLNGQVKEPGQLARGEAVLVALKLLRAELAANGRAVEYFLKEAEHAQRLRHPNILPVLESSGQAEGAWMLMRLAEGGSLAQLLEGGGLWRPMLCCGWRRRLRARWSMRMGGGLYTGT